jgi:hypothetical protein
MRIDMQAGCGLKLLTGRKFMRSGETEKDTDIDLTMKSDVGVGIDFDQNIRSIVEMAEINMNTLTRGQREHLNSVYWLFSDLQSNEKRKSLVLFFILKSIERPGENFLRVLIFFNIF